MGSKALVTCASLLGKALEAAATVGIPRERIYILEVAELSPDGTTAAMAKKPDGFKTIDDLISQGEGLPPLDKVVWEKGQGARQTAYFSTSSGTSGVPVCFLPSLELYEEYARKGLTRGCRKSS